MGELTYTALMSLDGYVADTDGRFDWATPDETVHELANNLQRERSLQLYGRRMYEVMSYWQGVDVDGDDAPVHREFARLWQDSDKVVFSRSLTAVSTPRTELVHDFDPDRVRRTVAQASTDVAVSGPTLAAVAFAAGLVATVDLIVFPVTVGAGLPALPGGVELDPVPVDNPALPGGVEHHRYRVRGTNG